MLACLLANKHKYACHAHMQYEGPSLTVTLVTSYAPVKAASASEGLWGPAQSAFDTIAIIVLIPVYDRLLAPYLRWTYLQRIGWGLVVRRAYPIVTDPTLINCVLAILPLCLAVPRVRWLGFAELFIVTCMHA